MNLQTYDQTGFPGGIPGNNRPVAMRPTGQVLAWGIQNPGASSSPFRCRKCDRRALKVVSLRHPDRRVLAPCVCSWMTRINYSRLLEAGDVEANPGPKGKGKEKTVKCKHCGLVLACFDDLVPHLKAVHPKPKGGNSSTAGKGGTEKGSSGGGSAKLAEASGALVHQLQAADDVVKDVKREAQDLKADLQSRAAELKREIEENKLERELRGMKQLQEPPKLDISRKPVHVSASRMTDESPQCHRKQLESVFVIGDLSLKAARQLLHREGLSAAVVVCWLILALAIGAGVGLAVHYASEHEPSPKRFVADPLLCIVVAISTSLIFIIPPLIVHMCCNCGGFRDNSKIKHVRLIGVLKCTGDMDLPDSRPEMDRAEDLTKTRLACYRLLVEIRTARGYYYFKDWPEDNLPDQWYKPHGRTLKHVWLNVGLLSTALNRKTLLAARSKPAVAIDTMIRMISANPHYQEDLSNLIETGGSIYRDMSLICGAIVSRDPYTINESF